MEFHGLGIGDMHGYVAKILVDIFAHSRADIVTRAKTAKTKMVRNCFTGWFVWIVQWKEVICNILHIYANP